MSARRIEIVGGGLAGLALGIGLRRRGVEVTIHEAGNYPRHRVCGEFICGLKPGVAAELGLQRALHDAALHRRVAWFWGERKPRFFELPSPALGISRYVLDERLAGQFVELGGELVTDDRMGTQEAPPGRVFTTGRQRSRETSWVGLKVHALNLTLAADLELHLGRGAYVGLCRVGGDRVNVCGLFHWRGAIPGNRAAIMTTALRHAGLQSLAERLEDAELDPRSACAVAGLSFQRPEIPRDRLYLGDAYAMMPPFAGHGMALAFENAALAIEPMEAWFHGGRGWLETVESIQRRLRRTSWSRFGWANALHPLLLRPRWQAALDRLQGWGYLPVRAAYHALH